TAGCGRRTWFARARRDRRVSSPQKALSRAFQRRTRVQQDEKRRRPADQTWDIRVLADTSRHFAPRIRCYPPVARLTLGQAVGTEASDSGHRGNEDQRSLEGDDRAQNPVLLCCVLGESPTPSGGVDIENGGSKR